MTARILIVEDEDDLSAIIADYARAAGFEPVVMSNGNAALASVRQSIPDLIVLDIMLPGMDGLSLCNAVRAFSDVPIIMVTARVEEIDRLLGLEAGADDYLCKPFSPRELVARIKAILRRHRMPDDDVRLIEVDEPMRTVRIRSQPLELTATEFNLFAAMARRPGHHPFARPTARPGLPGQPRRERPRGRQPHQEPAPQDRRGCCRMWR